MKPHDEQDRADTGNAAPSKAAANYSNLVVHYEGDHLLPRSVRVIGPDGAEVKAKRVVIEIVQNSLPRVLEMEQ